MTLTRLTVGLLGLLILSAGSYADGDQENARRLVNEGIILPLERIAESARRLHPGRILEVELEKKQGRYLYEIEIITDRGEVWEMKFDAVTGEILKHERED